MADAMSFTVLQDLKYRENDEKEDDVVPKNKLDLFLPRESNSCTPVVVFVHGGGWIRGDKQLFRHFSSLYDTNLLMYFITWYYNAYWNVGETFARNGVACAVVSYRLSRLYFPWILIQTLCSFSASFFVIFVPLFSVTILINIFFPIYSSNFFNVLQIVGISSLLILWIFVCKNDADYKLSNSEKVLPLLSLIPPLFSFFSTPFSSFISYSFIWITVVFFFSFATLNPKTKPAKYPGHICDVAQCIKWIRNYGKTSQRFSSSDIFLCGHSAGGHIVSSLAINSKYLNDVGMSFSDIKVNKYVLPKINPSHPSMDVSSTLK